MWGEDLADTREFREILIMMLIEPSVVVISIFLKYLLRHCFLLLSYPVEVLSNSLSNGFFPLFQHGKVNLSLLM